MPIVERHDSTKRFRRERRAGALLFARNGYGVRVPSPVFPNLIQLIAGRPLPAAAHAAFVEDVQVRRLEPRAPRAVRLIGACWGVIALKHVAVIWVVGHYHVPFHPLWVNIPTWLLGVLATGLYYGRTRRV